MPSFTYTFKKCSLLLLTLFGVSLHTHAETNSNAAILQYIHTSWHDLTRTTSNCGTYQDIKVTNSPFLYLPKNAPETRSIKNLVKICHIHVKRLPRSIEKIGDVKTDELAAAGLLYLPYPYVVPGGRFNEMYGWDSYFIILGLLHDGENQLANNMLENYFYEIKYYGTILNANRTYHLSRSQPPFLTSAILAVYDIKTKHKTAWLKRAYSYAKKDYKQWISSPFLAGNTTLSRYYDVEKQPLVEERAYPSYYEKILAYLPTQPNTTDLYQKTEHNSNQLSPQFYQGERSLRASGFDITSRFGTFGARTHYFAPVCLNSLLYKTEKDLAKIAAILHLKSEEAFYNAQAEKRKKAINTYLWDAKTGIYVDYDFVLKKQSDYHYATTFYPLWAGVASTEQAQAVIQHIALFEQAGGLAMSDQDTGLQWDKPFGWAPVQLLAVQGLMQYHDKSTALRIAQHFNQTINADFFNEHKIFEKYNVIQKTSAFSIKLGYQENVVGFGWTNSTYLLFDDLLKKYNVGASDALPL